MYQINQKKYLLTYNANSGYNSQNSDYIDYDQIKTIYCFQKDIHNLDQHIFTILINRYPQF